MNVYESALEVDSSFDGREGSASLTLSRFDSGAMVGRSQAGTYRGTASFDVNSQLLQFTSSGLNVTWCVGPSADHGMASITGETISVMKPGRDGKKLASSTGSWVKSRAKVKGPGLISIDTAPNAEEAAWADHLLNSGRGGPGWGVIRSWLVDPAFEEAFGKPLRKMTGPEARGTSSEFSRHHRSSFTDWEEPYPQYRVVYSLLRGLKTQDYIRAHAVHSLSGWYGAMGGRLATLEDHLGSFVSMNRQEEFARANEAYMATTFEASWKGSLESRRRQIASPALERSVAELVQGSKGGHVPAYGLGGWRSSLAELIRYSDASTVQSCAKLIGEEADRILPSELSRSLAEVEQLDDGLVGLSQSWALYVSTQRQVAGLEDRPAYREWMSSLRKVRDRQLGGCWEAMEDRISRASKQALSGGLPDEWFGVAGDTSSDVHRLATAALQDRQSQLTAQATGEALAPVILVMALAVALSSDGGDAPPEKSTKPRECPYCNGGFKFGSNDRCDHLGCVGGTIYD